MPPARDPGPLDPLTGAGARSRWPLVVGHATPGAAVALLDLDRMKHFNMHNGHTRGDEVLAQLAAHLVAADDDGREVLRVGGQSFAIVWPAATTPFEQAAERCAAIASWAGTTLAAGQAEVCGDPHCLGPTALGVTIALTRLRADDEPASLLARLDDAVVQGKRAGRGRVVEA